MVRDFVASLKAEIDALEAELSSDVRFLQLIELKKLLELYERGEKIRLSSEPSAQKLSDYSQGIISRGSSLANVNDEKFDGGIGVRSLGRKASPEKSRAIEAVALHLENRIGPVPTRDLLDHINDLGIEIGGTIPINNLSAMLSNSDQFDSHGRSGWTLKRKKTQQQILIEGMEKSVDLVLSSLSDESLAGVQGYIREFSELPENVVEALTTAYEEMTGVESTHLNNRKLRAIFEQQLSAEIEDRASSFARD